MFLFSKYMQIATNTKFQGSHLDKRCGKHADCSTEVKKEQLNDPGYSADRLFCTIVTNYR